MDWTHDSAKQQGESDRITGKKPDTTGKPVDWANSYKIGYDGGNWRKAFGLSNRRKRPWNASGGHKQEAEKCKPIITFLSHRAALKTTGRASTAGAKKPSMVL
jgi:hypothetical protein